MKISTLITISVCAIVGSGVASAKSIVYDSGQWSSPAVPPGTVNSSTGTLPIDGDTLIFMPGSTTFSTATGINMFTGAYQFNWGSDPSASDPPGISEQVIVSPLSPTSFSVDFNYANTSCASETASFKLNSQPAYTASNPCLANTYSTANEFVITGEKVTSEPMGWTGGPISSVPEPASAFLLLAGWAAIVLGRRRSADRASG
jgi:hypothetical protein